MNDYVSIAELGKHVGSTVTLRGWIQGKRSGGKVVFLLLRDGTGVCQCVVEAKEEDAFALASTLGQESSVILSGSVREDIRSPGGYEMSTDALAVIQASEEYPISRKAHGIDFLMGHRHLWLRSERQSRILKIRHTIICEARRFFDDRGFTLIDTPILSPGAAEGAGTLFPVDYFGEEVYLAQTGQLYLESACQALGKVYCFGPTFRAEKSKTRRHLTEFWMIEPEVAFAELADLCDLAEAFVEHIVQSTLGSHREDLKALGRNVEALERIKAPFHRLTYSEAAERLRSDEVHEHLLKDLAADKVKLQSWITQLDELERTLGEARKEWQKEKLKREIHELRDEVRSLEEDLRNRPAHIESARNFEWGKDFGGDEETILCSQFDRPAIVTRYPRDVKAFYMKTDANDPRVVLNLDVLAPEGYGEIIGGSQREDSLEALVARMDEEGMEKGPYEWYLDLRRYGSVPHGGFGLGIERTVAWICGLKHIRETIPFPRLMSRIYP